MHSQQLVAKRVTDTPELTFSSETVCSADHSGHALGGSVQCRRRPRGCSRPPCGFVTRHRLRSGKLLSIARNRNPISRRPSPTHDVTALLRAWTGGQPDALNDLMPLVYDELRRLAKRHMARERLGHTLQPTALINEAYLRLIDLRRVRWQDRAHFFAMAARVMRRVLVDAARSRQSRKRGSGAQKASLVDASAVAAGRPVDFVQLDDALQAFAAVDPRKAQVVELRFFGGLTVEESAQALGVSVDTVKRDWKLAKAWLTREMRKETGARDAV